jgi:biofilm PGA synthesis lipoprotein PgaB
VQALIDWTGALMTAVRRHRPEAQSARTLYAPVLIEPESERWFAQSYAASLQAYDEVVVMAYPLMEKIEDPLP